MIGSLVGSLVTKKKKKKLNKQMGQQMGIQAAAQKEAQRIEQLKANFGTKLEKIQQLREGRIRRAQVIASGVNAGVGVGSSATQGGAQATYSTAVGNFSGLNVYQSYSEATSQQNQIAADAGARQQVLGAKLQTQQDKANLIGGALDTGIGLATLPWGGISGAATSLFGGNKLTGVKNN